MKKKSWQEKIRVGQEWYFFSKSRAYMISGIEEQRWQYPDGEVYEESGEIKLRSVDNHVKTLRPEDFDNGCKLTKDVKGFSVNTIKIFSVPHRSRLERIDD